MLRSILRGFSAGAYHGIPSDVQQWLPSRVFACVVRVQYTLCRAKKPGAKEFRRRKG